ncbi:f9022fa0-0969-4e2e-9dab-3389a67aa1ee [Thermothielavioides terrestris]|uniref:F9022fa0-0969-4e2e-9dab-3389a67aa1ee n=1 Tax=Thermothielavioides terrestris TaxID=2587410 RepID=A0A446B753_9PEZI|nr:f9022fa0-0969-4e2e-9dab-3389a67aa1ee [Thermothielavioides terrestris]
MATRQERMRDRMRGAGKHNVGDVDFGFIIPVAEEHLDEPEEPPFTEEPPRPPVPVPAPVLTARPTPNTSAKRKHLDRDAPHPSQPTTAPPTATGRDIYDIPDHSTEGGSTIPAPPSAILERSPSLPRPTRPAEPAEPEAEDQPMIDAPPVPLDQPTTSTRPAQRRTQPPRGPLSSVISATKRLSFDPSSSPPRHPVTARAGHEEMEVTESPADAPGSGRRRPLRLGAGTPVVGSSTLLHKVLEDVDGDGDGGEAAALGSSSPIERRVRTRRSGELRRARMSVSGAGPERAAAAAAASAAAVAESEAVEEVAEDSTALAGEDEGAEVEGAIGGQKNRNKSRRQRKK